MFKNIFELENGKLSKNPFRIAIQSMRNFKFLAFVSFFVLILQIVFYNLIPLFNKYFFDAIEVLNFTNIYKFLFLYIFILVFHQIFTYTYFIASSRLYAYMQTQIRKDVLGYLNLHSLSYFASRPSGKVTNEYHNLYDCNVILFVILENIIPSIIVLVVSVVLAFTVNVYVGIGILIWNILTSLLSVKFIKLLAKRTQELEFVSNYFMGIFGDFVSNIKILRIFNVSLVTRNRLTKIVKDYCIKALRKWRFKSIFNTFLDFCDVILILILTIVLGNMYFNNLISLGDITMLFTLAYRIDDSFKDLMNGIESVTTDYEVSSIAAQNILVDIDNLDKGNAKKLPLLDKVSISIKNLSFRYPKSKSKSNDLSSINLEIKSGEKIGIVGRSGSGKSTLFKLLQRQFEFQDAQIFFNDLDVNDYTKQSVRNNISVVDQDNQMFNRSLKENILLGRKVSEKKLKQVLNDSHCNEFIKNIPDGLDALVGERGVKLSGGQRQRVAIARSMISKAPLVLLDEATSALDSKSEKVISDAFEKLSKDHTMICIAHRLSTLHFVDRIVVMDKGRIVNVGTHDDLLKTCNIYQTLSNDQLD